MRLRNLLTPALVLAALVFPAPGHAAGDTEKGRAIAIEHCSRCHVVGGHNPMGGIGSTPSFQLLRSMMDWRDRFGTFYARRPHPVHVRIEGLPTLTDLPPNAAPFTITIADVDHILAFAETLDPLW